MSKHLTAIGLFSVICLAVVMTACGGTARIEERSKEAVNVTHPSSVVIETFNGNIEVVTGADDKVAVEVTKYARQTPSEPCPRHTQCCRPGSVHPQDRGAFGPRRRAPRHLCASSPLRHPRDLTTP